MSKSKAAAGKEAPAGNETVASETTAPAEPASAAKVVEDAVAPLRKELEELRAENEAFRKQLKAPVQKVQAQPAPEVDPNLLMCYKNTIRFGEHTIKRGDKVHKEDLAKLPPRLHRWFQPQVSE